MTVMSRARACLRSHARWRMSRVMRDRMFIVIFDGTSRKSFRSNDYINSDCCSIVIVMKGYTTKRQKKYSYTQSGLQIRHAITLPHYTTGASVAVTILSLGPNVVVSPLPLESRLSSLYRFG